MTVDVAYPVWPIWGASPWSDGSSLEKPGGREGGGVCNEYGLAGSLLYMAWRVHYCIWPGRERLHARSLTTWSAARSTSQWTSPFLGCARALFAHNQAHTRTHARIRACAYERSCAPCADADAHQHTWDRTSLRPRSHASMLERPRCSRLCARTHAR